MTSLATNMSVRTNLQYIAVAEMRNEVFQYSTSTVNFKTTGTFTAPYRDGQTQGVSIPAGTILVETGKKLYRGPNPNVPTFLVQVMAFTNGSATDGKVTTSPGNGQSLLDANNKAVFGFIDPSSPNVALYSVERNPDHADGLYYSSLALLTAGGNVTTTAGYATAGGVAHKGPSLFTGGTVTAGAGVTITGGALQQAVSTISTITSSALTINTSLANVFIVTPAYTGTQTISILGAVGSIFTIVFTGAPSSTPVLAIPVASATCATVQCQVSGAAVGATFVINGGNVGSMTGRVMIIGVITAAAT
uniref:Uncharacterized protein n=1 Tax=viral metagenome TaxID=1070528 RepID=A0A6C0IE21_9ZZZZ